jgi:hypothetical protein
MGGLHASWPRTLVTTVVLTLLASACGGGGGGGDGSTRPVGPGDTEKFFPDAVGDTWFYDSTFGDPAEPNMHQHGFGQVEVTGTKSFGNVTARIFRTSSTDDPSYVLDTYYGKDGNGVTNHGNNDPSDTLTSAIVPYLEAKFPLAIGVITNVSRSNVDFGEDLDGDLRNEKIDFSLRISMDGFEAQTVPAGTFGRTARRTSKIEGTIRTTSSGNVPFSATDELWSAPGVGIVRQRTTFSAGGIADQQGSAARGYKVDGVAHGMGLPQGFVSGLNMQETMAPAIASNGSDGFVLAATRQTGTSPITSRIVAAFGDADGRLMREIDVTSPAVGYIMSSVEDVAFDGTNYLLLYANGTSNPGTNPLLATRISPSGTVLDATGFEIAPAGSGNAVVAYGGSHYLVVYQRYDNTSGRHNLYGRLVTPAGSVVGADEFPIGPRDQNELLPDVAFDGTNFLVVWQQQPLSGSDAPDKSIVATRVSEAAVVLDPGGIVVSYTGKGSETPRVGFGGGQYLVVWVDGRNAADWTEGFDIYGARVDTNGGLLDGPATTGGLRISGDRMPEAGYPQAVYIGSEFLVTWSARGIYAPTPESGIFGARVSPVGAVNRGGSEYGIALSGEPAADSPDRKYTNARTVRLGSRYVVAWVDTSNIKDVVVYSLE